MTLKQDWCVPIFDLSPHFAMTVDEKMVDNGYNRLKAIASIAVVFAHFCSRRQIPEEAD